MIAVKLSDECAEAEPQISLPNRLGATQTGKWNQTNVN